MIAARLLDPVRRQWFSEESPLALRSKQFIATVMPESVLLGLKKRYYLGLLKRDGDDRMETDARALPLLVHPGDFVIDVGAFVGFYTQRLSRLVGPGGVVWSFEPMPHTFDILTTAVRELRLSNVRTLPYALSDSVGAATMEVPRYKGGGESWWDAKIVEGSQRPDYRHVEIARRTLDLLLSDNTRPVAFIKIDAEFHELHCVRGAMESLRRWHPVVQVEMLGNVDDPNSDVFATVDLLASLGYTPHHFDGSHFHQRRRGETQQNLFFFSAEHRNIL